MMSMCKEYTEGIGRVCWGREGVLREGVQWEGADGGCWGVYWEGVLGEGAEECTGRVAWGGC